MASSHLSRNSSDTIGSIPFAGGAAGFCCDGGDCMVGNLPVENAVTGGEDGGELVLLEVDSTRCRFVESPRKTLPMTLVMKKRKE